MSISTLTKQKYANYERWDTYISSGKDLSNMQYHLSWIAMFANLLKHHKFKKLNDAIKSIIEKTSILKFIHSHHILRRHL